MTIPEQALRATVLRFVHCVLIEPPRLPAVGLTEHDKVINFGGQDYRPDGSTFSASEFRLGIQDNTMDFLTVADNESSLAEDVRGGKYDNSEVSVYYVDWTNPEMRLLLTTGSLGESERKGERLTFTYHSLSERLQRPIGRTYGLTCDADLGDERCRASNIFETTGTVIHVTNNRLLEVVLANNPSNQAEFNFGFLRFTSGSLQGSPPKTIHSSYSLEGRFGIELYLSAPLQINTGDEFIVRSGCDKSMGQCRGRFNNLINYQGFPWIPGDERLVVSGTECEDDDETVKESDINQQTGERIIREGESDDIDFGLDSSGPFSDPERNAEYDVTQGLDFRLALRRNLALFPPEGILSPANPENAYKLALPPPPEHPRFSPVVPLPPPKELRDQRNYDRPEPPERSGDGDNSRSGGFDSSRDGGLDPGRGFDPGSGLRGGN